MRSFFVSMPPNDKPPARVLLYLHGVGEAFDAIPDKVKDELQQIEDQTKKAERQNELVLNLGAENLFNHGIPRIFFRPASYAPDGQQVRLEPPPFPLAPFTQFLTIAPQTLFREDMSNPEKVNQMMERACKIAAALVGDKPKIAIMAFSRGGVAAFQWLAGHEDVKVIVSMDAAAVPEAAAQKLQTTISETGKPFWAFFTDYPDNEDRRVRITEMHRKIPVDKASLTAVPSHKQCKTELEIEGDTDKRHSEVCAQVTRSEVVYNWILRWL